MTTTVVIGGARSGKSSYAERLALSLTERPVYVATSRPWDDDHQRRIARHRRDRGSEWRTIEEPRHPSAIGLEREVVVVDCVTLWLTNVFVDLDRDFERCLAEARCEIDRAIGICNTWIFVTNELGQGVHAPDEATRRFVDLQGFVNQHLAARAEGVALMVAGVPHYVKGSAPTR